MENAGHCPEATSADADVIRFLRREDFHVSLFPLLYIYVVCDPQPTPTLPPPPPPPPAPPLPAPPHIPPPPFCSGVHGFVYHIAFVPIISVFAFFWRMQGMAPWQYQQNQV